MNKLDLVQCEDTDDELLGTFRSVASSMASQAQAYRREIARCYADIDMLKADRDEWKRDAERLGVASVKEARITRTRETIDGIDCERIKGLDVIVPVGLIPEGEEPKEVRSYSLPFPSRWIYENGAIETREFALGGDRTKRALVLLLADKPAPAPVPMWTPPASLPEATYRWIDSPAFRLEKIDHDWAAMLMSEAYSDWTNPPREGLWKVESNRATYLGPDEEATP